LNNVTLIMNCSFDGEYHIEVRAIGELNLINNSTIKSNNSTFRYDFYYLKNSRGTISNSTIMNAGWDYFAGSRGLFIESDFITVEDSTFDNNYIDIWCEDSSPTIKFNKILTEFDSYSEPGERFQLGGIDLIGGKPKIFNNLISNSISGISFEASSSPLIINNFIKNSSYDGISCGYESSYPIIENNTIISCGSAGIGIWAAYPILRNNTISDCDYGIWINTYWTYILTPIIENCTISDSKINDLYIEDNCHPIFINGTFNKKNVCFKFDRSYNPSLTLQWYLKVKILDENNNSIRNASVIIKELKVNEIYNDTTDSNGYTGLITCTEYIQQDKNNDTDGNDPGEKDYHTPHNITVSIEYKGGIYKFYQDIFMDKSKNITIKINTSNIKNLTPDLTISYQDIIFSNNTPIEGDIVRINATIYNQGKTKVDKAEIKFYDNNITLENQIGDLPNIKNLNPNNRTQVTIDWNTTAKIGNHTIYVVIENSNPCEEYIDNNIAFKNITIKLKNQNPNADISCNKSIGYTNEEMIFNGSASYDPDGYIQAYYFDFGDGNSSNWTSKQIVTHNYSMQGKYVASLKVRDNEDVESDNLAQIEITINKRNHMPIIENISVNPLIIEPNGKAIITVDAFDPDFDGLDYLYETTEGIILGDGCNVTWQAPEIEGEYTINVKVFDGRAYSKSTSVNITVRKNNTAPIITDITTNPSEVNPRGTSVIIINV
ncbi:MAG: right-handed parallel beta-helix repeat-containing protein, partial [Thermoplasmata archaeon]|nr:right-handed parallel beta-helix repeat-containing protein [Thermoplasmata archaeon]